jgi:hypothetical protein
MPRLSLRELLVFVALVALAIVSLMYASPVWHMIIGVTVVLSAMIALITGLVDRGPRRAFPIGFAVGVLGYLFVLVGAPTFTRGPFSPPPGTTPNSELGVYDGSLPTSKLLGYLYAGIKRTKYFDAKTGELIPPSERDNLAEIGEDRFGDEGTGSVMSPSGMFAGATVQWPAGKRPATYQVRPHQEHFMAIGQFWWALLFGYIGGHFAQFIYKRRAAEQPAPK